MADLLLLVLGGAWALFCLWLLFLLVVTVPSDMAKERNRDPFAWVLISLPGTPFLAIFLLWLLGDISE
ncbi:hypothetical protein [Planktotalea arctica]|uniref:hypothetical protein n=1 Tax=Planktotalea arctica TaxID=1481893 RepID=UPI000A177981|nr:hypothetical protein [Planktotalea arctica]